MENLHCGHYLLVKVSLENLHGEHRFHSPIMVIYTYIKQNLKESELGPGTAKSEVLCHTNEL